LPALNEGKACDAIIRLIEARADAQRSNLHLHDAHPDPDRRVELTFELGAALYAMEHTSIEPFADFMQMNGASSRLFEPIRRRVSPVVPSGEVWEMHIPLGALTGRDNKDLRRIQDALAHHVITTAPQVPIRSYADYVGDLRPVTPPNVPFLVNLYRFGSLGLPSRFDIVHTVPGSSKETLRSERLLLACRKKFPKLAAWKRSDCARTILILEDNDIQLTNQVLVADAFLPLAMARDDRPDETYMIMTCTEPWYVWPILIDGKTYFDRPDHFEIDPTTLTAVTGR
jgi:hypothetical protein